MTRKGVWNLQQVRDKYLQSLWENTNQLWLAGRNTTQGNLGQNNLVDYSSPVQVPGNWNALSVATYDSTLARKTDGTLWGWGYNYYGGLGQNSEVRYSSPVQVGTDTTWGTEIIHSGGHSTATKTDGTLWAWGYNTNGQLGLNNTTQYSSPIQVGSGTDWATGNDKLSTSASAVFGIKTDGSLWVWGRQDHGQLASNEQNVQYSSPIQIPGTWSTATVGGGDMCGGVKTDGTLWMWGSASNGALGQNEGGTYRRSSPVQIPGTSWKQLACSESASMATRTDGTLWGWGSNDEGYLGINTNEIKYSSPVQCPGTTWDKVNSGGDHFMAVKTDGTLWTWGLNDYGQLALGDRGPSTSTARSSPTQVPGTWTLDNVSHGKNNDVFGAIKKGLTPSQL